MNQKSALRHHIASGAPINTKHRQLKPLAQRRVGSVFSRWINAASSRRLFSTDRQLSAVRPSKSPVTREKAAWTERGIGSHTCCGDGRNGTASVHTVIEKNRVPVGNDMGPIYQASGRQRRCRAEPVNLGHALQRSNRRRTCQAIVKKPAVRRIDDV